jgi:hypothetical protein
MPRSAAYLDKFREIINETGIKVKLLNKNGDINQPTSKSALVVEEIVKLLVKEGFQVNNNTIYSRIRQASSFNQLAGVRDQENNRSEKQTNIRSFHKKVEVLLQLKDEQSLLPESKRVDGRLRMYPKPGWTETAQDLLSKELKVPCSFRFKYISFSNVYCSAQCSECGLLIHARLLKNSEERYSMCAEIQIAPDSSKNHKKARQIRGFSRDINLKDSALNHYNKTKLKNVESKSKNFLKKIW